MTNTVICESESDLLQRPASETACNADIPAIASSAVGTVLLDLTYGAHDKHTTERFLHYAKKSADTLAEIFLPGALLVQYIPFLRYCPSWFPGSSYKDCIETWRETFRLAVNEPFDDVKTAMVCLHHHHND